MTPQEKAVKELTDGRGKVHTTDNQGRTLVYDRIRDNITSTGVWVDEKGNKTPFNGF
jgi:hypothetical protein